MQDAAAKGRVFSGGRGPIGERNGKSKLSANQVALVRQLRSRGSTIIELAERFGVHKATISRAARGMSYPTA